MSTATANHQHVRVTPNGPHSRLPRIVKRDQWDYPKIVRWSAITLLGEVHVELERFFARDDRPCPGCRGTITADTFYVRVRDHMRPTGPFIRGRRLAATSEFHPECVPAVWQPALVRLEVPES
jgi:hypothetical protein